MEPRTSQPHRRLDAIRAFSDAGVPVGALVAPIIPGLNDHGIPSIISAVADAGANFTSYTILRLPYANKTFFDDWLTQHFPERKEKVLNRIRAIRGGQLNETSFGSRMSGQGIFADQISDMFSAACKKASFTCDRPHLSTSAFKRPTGLQLCIFE